MQFRLAILGLAALSMLPAACKKGGGGGGAAAVPPSIITQPQNATVAQGQGATFIVSAAGTEPLTYQWRKGGASIPSGTAAALAIFSPQPGDAGSYDVVVSNAAGSVTSSAATLTVNVPPSITVQPVGQTVTAPAAGTFSVTATGTPPLSYQWSRGGAALAGANAPTYTTPATTFSDNGVLFVVTVSNSAGSTLSNPAALTVNAAPTIQVQPAGQTVTAPAAATFSVTAAGTLPLSYQWKKDGADIGGATASSYTTPATTVGDTGSLFSVQVSNAYGNVLSADATLTVNTAAPIDLTVPTVYITQSTQTPAFNVPLVKDRNGYLRAFVVANQANTVAPQVRVRIYDVANNLLQTWTIDAPGASVPLSVDESSLAKSWNVAIPSTYIQPGNKLLVDVDPTNAIAESNESNNTWPASGTPYALNVVALNPFRVTFWAVKTGDGRVGNVNSGLITSWTSLLESIWPTNNATDRVFGGIWTTSVTTLQSGGGGWSTCLNELDAKRTADGVTNRYYYGVVNPNYDSGVAGLGYLGSPTAIGWDKSAGYGDNGLYMGVYAHETGHNFGLDHAPCGVSGDPAYPYAGGLIGVWGADVAGPTLKDPSVYHDIMGYCDTVWVSDYNYKKVLANRQGGSVPIIIQGGGDPAEPRSLLLWGRLENGVAILEPAFHMAVDAQPPKPGDQFLEGFDAAGARLFFVPFSLAEVGCFQQGTARHFSFSVPLSRADAARLAELCWTRAGELQARRAAAPAVGDAALQPWAPAVQPMLDGRTRLQWDAASKPMAMVRDKATGLVLGFGRGGDFRFAAEADELEVHVSDGIHIRSTVLRRPRLDD
jgi:hypothetical protein